MIESVIMKSDGSLEKNEVNRPALNEGEVLVKTHYSEVCGTDVHLSHGRLSGVPYPIIPGHVSVGEIDEVRGIVEDIDGEELKKGDLVTFLDVHETCNNCWYCLVAKSTTRCPKRKVYGITYSANDGLLGGWSQYILLKAGVKIIKLPDGTEAKKFIAAGCGLPTAVHGIERAAVKLGDTVVVQGSGPVGLMAAILAKRSGAFKVIMIGAPQLRLDIATQFGIDHVINIEDLDPVHRIQAVLKLTSGRGGDITIEATGNPKAVVEGMRMTRDQGTYVVVGQYTDVGEVSFNPHSDLNKKHLTIKGSWGSDFSHFYRAVRFIAEYQDEYPWDQIISRAYTLDEATQALSDVAKMNVMKAVISPNGLSV